MTTPAQAITKREGGDWHGTYGALPGPGHSRRDRSVTVIDGERGPVFNSFAGQDWRELRRHYLGEDGPQRPELSQAERARLKVAAEIETAKKVAAAQAIWASGQLLTPGSIASIYLTRARGIDPRAFDCSALRWRWTGKYPELIAAAATLHGEIRAVQLTRLQPDGDGKAEIEVPRVTFGRRRGTAVQIMPASPPQDRTALAVAEGLETAMSLTLITGLPCWCSLGKQNFRHVPVPESVGTLIFAADRDKPRPNEKTSEEIATEAAATFKTAKRAALVKMPPPGFGDFNDCLVDYQERAAISDDEDLAWECLNGE